MAKYDPLSTLTDKQRAEFDKAQADRGYGDLPSEAFANTLLGLQIIISIHERVIGRAFIRSFEKAIEAVNGFIQRRGTRR